MRQILLFIAIVSILLTTISCLCGYNACHKTDPKKINFHLIPHTHDDVGWEQTPDGYYNSMVRRIITNVVKSLQVSPNRRFTYVEMFFFHRWWSEQNKQTQDLVKTMVENGQLTFTNGGWTVNDEGAAHYVDIIDQMTLGMLTIRLYNNQE